MATVISHRMEQLVGELEELVRCIRGGAYDGVDALGHLLMIANRLESRMYDPKNDKSRSALRTAAKKRFGIK